MTNSFFDRNDNISLVLEICFSILIFKVSIPCSIKKAFIGIENSHLQGEVIVADNGSTDNSIIEAENAGAKVVHVSEKGYGSALRGGIEKAENKEKKEVKNMKSVT